MIDNVNHPKHYNGHPGGIECIDVIRHYVCDIANAIKYSWRAGLKDEQGKDEADKEVEDLRKALWYIEDYRRVIPGLWPGQFESDAAMEIIVAEVTGWRIAQIAGGAKEHDMCVAMSGLLKMGIIHEGLVFISRDWECLIEAATSSINRRIEHILSHQIKNNNNEQLFL